jgi:DNA helicase II / ATP-dependent DNA helicase PcrA
MGNIIASPSAYQQAIIGCERPYVLVEAGPGSGKTATSAERLHALPTELQSWKHARYVAFNTEVKTQMAKLAPDSGMACTAHGLGRAAVKNRWYGWKGKPPENWIQNDKYADRIKGFANEYHVTKEKWYDWIQATSDLWDKWRLMMKGTDPPLAADVEQLCARFEIEQVQRPEDMAILMGDLAAFGVESAGHTVDFLDFLWLPWQSQLRMQTYTYGIVDECQDASPLVWWLVKESFPCRMMAVGDRMQWLYGWMGSNMEDMDDWAEEYGATRLPLPVSYRCPKSHIKAVQHISPELEAYKENIEGTIVTVHEDALFKDGLVKGSVIIGRKRKDIVRHAFRLLKRGARVRVQGSEIGKELEAVIGRVARRCNHDFDAFGVALREYQWEYHLTLIKQNRPQRTMEALFDRVASVQVIYDRATEEGITDIPTMLADLKLLSSEGNEDVLLTTIHGAKGREWDYVVLLDPDMADLMGRGEVTNSMEHKCLQYVQSTRSKDTIVKVTKSKY